MLPPFVAIVLALLTRRILPSLGTAVGVAAIVVAQGQPLATLGVLAAQIRDVVTSLDNWLISGFSLTVAGTIGIMGAAGGTAALVKQIERVARGRRGAMTASALAGGAVFFDDYANCLVVGNAMGPLCDRHRVSRAKLAYIVDSTAAPLASLALVSTWVGFEVGVLSGTLSGIEGVTHSGFGLFLEALPYRFYCILTLAFVLLVALSGRDFGPMYTVEANAQSAPEPANSVAVTEEGPAGPWHAALPIVTLVVATFGLLYADGRNALGEAAAAAPLFQILGAATAPFRDMLVGGLLACLLALGMALATGALTARGAALAMGRGMQPVLSALLVLYLAWTLGGLIQQTEAASVLGGLLAGRLAPWAVPAGVFLVSAATSFSTGSSFFTMLTVIPLALPLAVQLDPEAAGPLLLATSAAVLDGAVLGDHASPISDTTVLSSLGAGSDVATHVHTQLPYAVTVGIVALLAGSVPAGLGMPPWASLVAGLAMCAVVVFTVGRVSSPDETRARA